MMNQVDSSREVVQPLMLRPEQQDTVNQFTVQGPVPRKSSKSFKAMSLKDALEKEIEKLTIMEKKLGPKASWLSVAMCISIFMYPVSIIGLPNLLYPIIGEYVVPIILFTILANIPTTVVIGNKLSDLEVKLIDIESDKQYFEEFLKIKEFKLLSKEEKGNNSYLDGKIINLMQEELNGKSDYYIYQSLKIVKKYMESKRREQEALYAAIKLNRVIARGWDQSHNLQEQEALYAAIKLNRVTARDWDQSHNLQDLEWKANEANRLAKKARAELETLLKTAK